MPPNLLFDITGIDLDKVIHDQESIRQANPQRGHMEHLNGVVYVDPEHGRLIGYKDVRADEFWVPGHIPGRPLLPGVIMIEAAAQLAAFYTKTYLKWEGFIGFGAVDGCKFRLPVTPGCRLYLLGAQTWLRHGRLCSAVQGLVNGNVVFECSVVGTRF